MKLLHMAWMQKQGKSAPKINNWKGRPFGAGKVIFGVHGNYLKINAGSCSRWMLSYLLSHRWVLISGCSFFGNISFVLTQAYSSATFWRTLIRPMSTMHFWAAWRRTLGCSAISLLPAFQSGQLAMSLVRYHPTFCSHAYHHDGSFPRLNWDGEVPLYAHRQ